MGGHTGEMGQSIVVRAIASPEVVAEHVTRLVEQCRGFGRQRRGESSWRNTVRGCWMTLEALNSGLSYRLQLRRAARIVDEGEGSAWSMKRMGQVRVEFWLLGSVGSSVPRMARAQLVTSHRSRASLPHPSTDTSSM